MEEELRQMESSLCEKKVKIAQLDQLLLDLSS